MRRILIDTQVLIWLADNDHRLGKSARDLLNDTNNEISISFVSIYELTIKAATGKIHYDLNSTASLYKAGINVLVADGKSLEGYRIFDNSNKDPFDNALITIAINNGFEFITSDSKILTLNLNGLSCIDARS